MWGGVRSALAAEYHSKGSFNYDDKVVIDSKDITTLDNRIDNIVYTGTSAPEDKKSLWIDLAEGTFKVFNGTEWEAISNGKDLESQITEIKTIVNRSATVQLSEDAEYIELYDNGQWKKWKPTGLKFDGYFVKDGICSPIKLAAGFSKGTSISGNASSYTLNDLDVDGYDYISIKGSGSGSGSYSLPSSSKEYGNASCYYSGTLTVTNMDNNTTLVSKAIYSGGKAVSGYGKVDGTSASNSINEYIKITGIKKLRITISTSLTIGGTASGTSRMSISSVLATLDV